jgi:hypothetical protein
MPHPRTTTNWTEMTPEERRERRQLRREKQREANIGRAAKMHAARLKTEAASPKGPPELKPSVHVGCSGWRYWKWRDSFYAGVPQENWFEHYLKRFDTVEINASFYFVADGCQCSGLAAPVRKEKIRLHRQGL